MENIKLKKLKWVQESDIHWRLETIDCDMLCKVVKSKFKLFFVSISHKVSNVYAELPLKCDSLIEVQNEFVKVYGERLNIFFNISNADELILASILNPFEEETQKEKVVEVELDDNIDDDLTDEELYEHKSRLEFDEYLADESENWDNEYLNGEKYIDETPYGDSSDSYSEEEDDQYDADDSDDD